ncbi:MAG TPA: SigE family RNA polymerase sigma factor [Micromonosporaceae bacterium]|nr:SigE family RNA polymerase sigma factor [Micromonosporaceae bacterium]
MAPRLVAATWDGGPMLAADAATGWTADEAVTRLFAAHYRSLVRLATLLLDDTGRAEEIVSDAYVAMHSRWRSLDDTDKALAYLRATVVNRSRSALRHRRVVERHAAASAAEASMTAPSAESGALARLQHDVVLATLAELPARQREALVLRYYGDLSEAEIAEAMGCSRGAVKSHAARGMAALRNRMERWT